MLHGLLQLFQVGATAPCVRVVSLSCICNVERTECSAIEVDQPTVLALFSTCMGLVHPDRLPLLHGGARILNTAHNHPKNVVLAGHTEIGQFTIYSGVYAMPHAANNIHSSLGGSNMGNARGW